MLLASGLIVGESLVGVISAGLVCAGQTGALSFLGIGAKDPRAAAPTAVMPESFPDSALALILTSAVFAAVTAVLYIWVRAQAKPSK